MNISFVIDNSPNTSFYLIQLKGHYTPEWSTLYEDGYNITAFASSDPQTAFILLYGSNETSPEGKIGLFFPPHWGINVPLGSQLDFRLQAVSGNIVVSDWGANYNWAVGETSAWSNTQTIKVVESSPTPSPSVPSFPQPCHWLQYYLLLLYWY